MSNNSLRANIKLRFDTYSNWSVSSVILQPGEAAIAAFPDTHPGLPPRAFGVKVGDGERYFSELPWIQAIAADVYEWAKEPTKPTYEATEIEGLAEYIQAQTGGGGGGNDGPSSAYRITWNAASSKYILEQWDDTENDWVATASEIDLSSILNRINTIERWANGATTKLGNIEVPLTAYIYDEFVTQIRTLRLNDEAVAGQFVTSVSQEMGKISVTRAAINASQITNGVLDSRYGGTGLSQVDEDEVLVGSLDGTITKKQFVTSIDNSRNAFATTGAIIDYVNGATAGLNRAMHYIGETSVLINNTTHNHENPQIPGYNFTAAAPGDVILANGNQEYIWTGQNWYLLGSSYAVRGQIKNSDIAQDAAIDQDKIDGLSTALEGKVDKEEGKQLSSNDYTTEEKEKLEEIEEGAQVNVIEHIIVNDQEVRPNEDKAVELTIPILTEEQIAALDNIEPNVIEHIFVNGTEVSPTTINNESKSVNIEYVMTLEEKEKLRDIEAGAQVNKVETISFNGGEPVSPDINKNVDLTIDPAALDLTVIEGARYPSGVNTYTPIDVTNKQLELSKVAATGDIDDLIQTTNTYIILNCGSSTDVI